MNSPSFTLEADNSPLMYFGKLPSHGDFVRSPNGTSVIKSLDRWLSVCLKQLSTDQDWKANFDSLEGVHFAFIGSRSPSLLVGRIANSRDSSGRRFPFLVVGSIRTDSPLDFLPVLPMTMLPSWHRMEALVSAAKEAADLQTALSEIAVTPLAPRCDTQELASMHDAYLRETSAGTLQAMLEASGNTLSLRQSVVALGVLLAPLLKGRASNSTKGLALPLPAENNDAVCAAVFWLSLLAPFLACCNIELSLLHARLANRPQLIIGFGGANPRSLESIFNPALAFDANLDLCDVEWVESYIEDAYPLKKLSGILENPDLSLAQAIEAFSNAFIAG